MVRRPRESEISPVTIRTERRSVSVRGPTSPMMLVYGFVLIIAIGMGMLMLPCSNRSGEWGDPLIAAFTSTSAVAVTGLVVVDTYDHWSNFGHMVLMALMFVGGLGFMTGAAFLLMIVGQRLGLQGQLLMRAGLGEAQLGAIGALVRRIVIFSVAVQGVGAALLFLRWYVFGELWAGITWQQAVWQSLFHSVSAFNNAGFDIIPDDLNGGASLQPFGTDAPLLLIMSGLIIVGGLSYMALLDISTSRKFRKFRLDTKLVVVGSVGLLILGTAMFLVAEWSNEDTIGDQSIAQKMVSSFFHSTTARTAGFSTIDYNKATDADLIGTQALMFIGGASASTAGGIKVGTFVVIMIAAWATLRGKQTVNAFGREIPGVTIQRAMVVGSTASAIVLGLFIALAIAQPGLGFRESMFEIVSAFGTVGLSTGITDDLNTGGRIVVTITMFFGRFGPLTLALLMAGRESTAPYRYAEERVRIG